MNGRPTWTATPFQPISPEGPNTRRVVVEAELVVGEDTIRGSMDYQTDAVVGWNLGDVEFCVEMIEWQLERGRRSALGLAAETEDDSE